MSETIALPRASFRRSGIRLRVARHIREHEEAEWDSLLGPDDIQLSHRFIRTCEDARIENAEYWHVMIRDGDRPVGIASLCNLTVALDLLAPGWIRRSVLFARRWQPSVLKIPILVCGLPVSFGQPCIRIRSRSDPTPALSAIDGLMEDISRETGAGLLCFKEFDPDQARTLARLPDLGYIPAASLPSWTMDLGWGSFAEYVSSMRAPYRRQVRASLACRRRHGLTIRTVDDFASDAGTLYELYAEVMARADHRLEHLNHDFFVALRRNLGTACRAILVEREGDVLAAAVVIRTPGVFTFLLAGIDYERNVRTGAYLNLVLEVVAQAIASGARRLELGQTSDRLKSRLGARPAPRTLFLRHRSGVPHGLLRGTSRLLFPTITVPERRVFRGPEGTE